MFVYCITITITNRINKYNELYILITDLRILEQHILVTLSYIYIYVMKYVYSGTHRNTIDVLVGIFKSGGLIVSVNSRLVAILIAENSLIHPRKVVGKKYLDKL